MPAISSPPTDSPGGQGRGDAQEEGDGEVLEHQDAQHEVGLVVGQPAQVEERAGDDAAARHVDQARARSTASGPGPSRAMPTDQPQPAVDHQVDQPAHQHHAAAPPGSGRARTRGPRKNSSSTIPSRASRSVPSRGLDHRREARRRAQQDPRDDEDGDRREPQPPRQHARHRAASRRTMARSLSSSRGALGGRGGSAAPETTGAAVRALPTISDDVADALAVHAGQEPAPRSPAPCRARRTRSPVYTCTSDAPAASLSHASSAVNTPPTPITTRPPAGAAGRRGAPGRWSGRAAARPTGRPRCAVSSGGEREPLARERRVADDDPGQAALEGEVDGRVHLLRREVGRQLHQHRPRARRAAGAGHARVDRRPRRPGSRRAGRSPGGRADRACWAS